MAVSMKTINDNYFSRLLQRKGPNYIKDEILNEKEVNRSIEIIINDIINGRIDYNEYGYCILYRPVFDTLIGYCRDKKSMNESILFCMRYVLSQVGSASITVVGPMFPYIGLPGTIDQTTYDNIAYYYDAINREWNKYTILLQALESVQYSQNVYELMYVTGKLKMYSKGR